MTRSGPRKIICLVITNDRVLVAGLRGLLFEATDIEFVQCDPDVAASGEGSRPMADVALVDIERSLAPHERVIRALVSDTRVGAVGLVGRIFSRAAMQSARRLGVSVFVPTSLSPERLARAVREAAFGYRFEPGATTSPESDVSWLGKADGLTEREAQVLIFVAAGLTNRQIADRIFVSVETVRTHVKRAYHRLGLRNRAQASTYVHQLANPESSLYATVTASPRRSETVDVLHLEGLEGAFRTVGAAAWELGPDHLRIVAISGGHIGLSAVAASDRSGHRTLARFFPDDDGVRFLAMFAKLRVGDSRVFDHRIILPCGTTRDVRSSLVVSAMRNGAMVINGVTIDVTDALTHNVAHNASGYNPAHNATASSLSDRAPVAHY